MNTLSNLFLTFSPVFICTVLGNSMSPTMYPGQKVIALRFGLVKEGDIVVIKDPRNKILVIKRIKMVRKDAFFVEGDNKIESTDSRHYGWVPKYMLLGKVVYF